MKRTAHPNLKLTGHAAACSGHQKRTRGLDGMNRWYPRRWFGSAG